MSGANLMDHEVVLGVDTTVTLRELEAGSGARKITSTKNPKKSFALDKRDCRYLWFIFCYEEKIIIGSKQITFWHCHQLCFFAKSRSPKLIMHPPKERKKTSCFEVCE